MARHLLKILTGSRNRISAPLLSKRYAKDQRGVAAVEFALIVPILMLLFIGTLEISLMVAVDRKISRISSSVADLITQDTGDGYTPEALDKIADIAERIMYPYDDEVNISIVGVEIKNNAFAIKNTHHHAFAV